MWMPFYVNSFSHSPPLRVSCLSLEAAAEARQRLRRPSPEVLKHWEDHGMQPQQELIDSGIAVETHQGACPLPLHWKLEHLYCPILPSSWAPLLSSSNKTHLHPSSHASPLLASPIHRYEPVCCPGSIFRFWRLYRRVSIYQNFWKFEK